MTSRPTAQLGWRHLLAGGILLLLTGCAAPTSEEVEQGIAFEGRTMGTYYVVKVSGDWSEEERVRFQQAAEEELDDVNLRMSTYMDTSELSRFNQHVENTPFAVSQSLLDVVGAAQAIGKGSGGAYDVTLSPVIDAWGFGPGGEGVEGGVSDATLEELLAQVGNDYLEVDTEASTLSKQLPNLRVDLSSIAKGYAVDRVAERLLTLGATEHWVEVGGEVRAAGRNASGNTWLLGIERPQLMPGSVQRLLPLDNTSVATSGDYRNYREIDGERYSHIIDPRTGKPIRHRLASVSVVHEQCMMADGWATALMVMGAEEGLKTAQEQGLAALFLVRDGDDFAAMTTTAFDDLTVD